MELNFKDFGADRMEFDVCGERMKFSKIMSIYHDYFDSDGNLYNLTSEEMAKTEKIVGFFEDNKKLTAYCLDNPEHYYGAIVGRVQEGCAFCNEQKRVAQIQEEQAKKDAQNRLRMDEMVAQLTHFKETTLRLKETAERAMREAEGAKIVSRKAQEQLRAAVDNDEMKRLRAEVVKLQKLLPENVKVKYPVLSRENFLDFFDRSTSLESVFGGEKSAFDRVRLFDYEVAANNEDLKEEYRRDELYMDEILHEEWQREMQCEAEREIDEGRQGRY